MIHSLGKYLHETSETVVLAKNIPPKILKFNDNKSNSLDKIRV